MLVSPSEFLATSVLDFLQVCPLLSPVIADCISLSILRMLCFGEVLLYNAIKKRPLGALVDTLSTGLALDEFDELSVIGLNEVKTFSQVLA